MSLYVCVYMYAYIHIYSIGIPDGKNSFKLYIRICIYMHIYIFPSGQPMVLKRTMTFLKTKPKQSRNSIPDTANLIKRVLKEFKAQINIKQMIVGDFKTTLSTRDRSPGQK